MTLNDHPGRVLKDSTSMNDVFITSTAAFLPHEPVENEDIEDLLGKVGGHPSRARRIILRNNGIKTRHYAIDRSTGKPTFTNSQLTAQAIKSLDCVNDIELLVTGSSSPDQLLPNHGVMVHGELGWDGIEVVSTAGICLSGFTALKHAYLAIKADDKRCAVATGSERVSPHFMAEKFECESDEKLNRLSTRPELAFEKDFLRWMLSDGAGACLLENQPRGPVSLKIHWMDAFSYAHRLPTCMFAGAQQQSDGSLVGWADLAPSIWREQSSFAIQQDVRLLNENVIRFTAGEPLKELMVRRNLSVDAIDWFLPHISSMYFKAPLAAQLEALGLAIPETRWFTNLSRCGNTGSASPYIMLDELFRSGQLKKGQKLLLFVPESGRFSAGFAYLEVV